MQCCHQVAEISAAINEKADQKTESQKTCGWIFKKVDWKKNRNLWQFFLFPFYQRHKNLQSSGISPLADFLRPKKPHQALVTLILEAERSGIACGEPFPPTKATALGLRRKFIRDFDARREEQRNNKRQDGILHYLPRIFFLDFLRLFDTEEMVSKATGRHCLRIRKI